MKKWEEREALKNTLTGQLYQFCLNDRILRKSIAIALIRDMKKFKKWYMNLKIKISGQ